MSLCYREVRYSVVETTKDGGERTLQRKVNVTPIKMLNGRTIKKSDDEVISDGYKNLIAQGYSNVVFVSMKDSWMKL